MESKGTEDQCKRPCAIPDEYEDDRVLPNIAGNALSEFDEGQSEKKRLKH
jgi:hypothetical protein